jgi:hypothetical protein
MVTGTEDPIAATAALAVDPSKAADLRIALAKIVTDAKAADRQATLDTMKAQFADVADARKMAVALADSGSKMVWGAPVISVVVTVGFFAVVGAMVFGPTPSDAGKAAMLNILIFAPAAGWTSVRGYPQSLRPALVDEKPLTA